MATRYRFFACVFTFDPRGPRFGTPSFVACFALLRQLALSFRCPACLPHPAPFCGLAPATALPQLLSVPFWDNVLTFSR